MVLKPLVLHLKTSQSFLGQSEIHLADSLNADTFFLLDDVFFFLRTGNFDLPVKFLFGSTTMESMCPWTRFAF